MLRGLKEIYADLISKNNIILLKYNISLIKVRVKRV